MNSQRKNYNDIIVKLEISNKTANSLRKIPLGAGHLIPGGGGYVFFVKK